MKLKIVHLDDNNSTLSEIKKSFSNYNHPFFQISVHSFNSFKRFYELILKDGDIQLFLLDIDIKNKQTDGLLISKSLRTKFKNSVILMLSFFDNDVNINRAIENGADDFLTKNFDDSNIAATIVNSYERILRIS